jgi:hypothetical protein
MSRKISVASAGSWPTIQRFKANASRASRLEWLRNIRDM